MSEELSHPELVVRLHSAARQYCEARFAHWAQIYSKMDSAGSNRIPQRGGAWTYSDKARGTFPRYNIMSAILWAIETWVPDQLGPLPDARKKLIALSLEAKSPLNNEGEIEENAIDDERERFADFVESIDEMDLWEMRLLPYRRTLRQEEIERHWTELETRWGVQGSWIPLVETGIREPIIVARSCPFHQAVRPGAFRRSLLSLGVERVYELRELPIEPSRHLDVALVHPSYNGSEGFWFPEGKEWLLYASHEGSLTAAGEDLVAIIAEVWPEYRAHPWP